MSDRVQPGVKVDSALWQEFRNAVKQQKGGVRGHLRKELETALRLYIGDETDVSAVQVNQRLARIESEMGIAGTDGGTDTFEASEHTHAPNVSVDEKPSANAPTDKKVAYLAETIRDEHAGGFNEIPRVVLVDTVKDEYAFRSDTAKRYVERLVDHFNLYDHPVADGVLVTNDRRKELVEQQREQEREKAERELENL